MANQQRCILILHAHPDDEVFRTAGIFARYAAEGDRVVAVYATRGEAGEMHDPDRVPEEALPRLGKIREEEVRKACAILGVTELYFLGYRDSGMADSDENKRPDAFMNAPLDEAAGRLLEVIRRTRPQVVVAYDEHGEKRYGHPDHIMCNRVAVEAFYRAQGEPWAPQKLYYTASSREAFPRYVEGMKRLGLKIPWLDGDFNFEEYGLPEAEITAHIDIAPFVHLKKQALAVHRTQIPADFFYLSLPDEVLREHAGIEYYLRIHPAPRSGEYEDDLFAGTEVSTVAA
jgi:LmbE family N-acetylglucosaminyl deacetylase